MKEEKDMKQIPAGTELARPFMPARGYALSKNFYETLGFEKLLDGDVAIFKAGSGGFILQRHYQKEWAENFMMQLMVDNLDVWWTYIVELDLPGRFHAPLAVLQMLRHLDQTTVAGASCSDGN